MDSRAEGGLAPRLRGFGPVGVLAILVILFAGNPLIASALVLVWVRLSRTAWSEIGYVRPRSWITTVIGGIVFGTAFKFVMKAVVMPLLGAPPMNPTYHFLAGNAAALPRMIAFVVVSAGVGEETVFRGYLFERLRKLTGSGSATQVVPIVVSAVWFGLAHYPDQGLGGAEQALIVGLVFGGIYEKTRTLAPLMVAHAAFDLTAIAMIYWDLENLVAHSIFK